MWRCLPNFFSATFLFQFYFRPNGDITILCSRPNSCCQQNPKCFDKPHFPKVCFLLLWKSSNDCSTEINMFFKPQPGLGLQYPICADMLLSLACQRTQDSD